MEVLPEGEQFVGTRGGGMDHAASLASRAGLRLADRIRAAGGAPHPGARGLGDFWSPTAESRAEKVRARAGRIQRAAHGRLRGAGTGWGWHPYRAGALRRWRRASNASEERDAFLHVATEAVRVRAAVAP